MSEVTWYDRSAVGPADTKSTVVHIDRAVSGHYPALRFPLKGHVIGAYVFADAAASGTNLVQVGLINGGVTGAGTIITAAQTSGTLVAGSAYSLTISTGGPDVYDVGELCMLNLTTTDSPTDVAVQIDYALAPL